MAGIHEYLTDSDSESPYSRPEWSPKRNITNQLQSRHNNKAEVTGDIEVSNSTHTSIENSLVMGNIKISNSNNITIEKSLVMGNIDVSNSHISIENSLVRGNVGKSSSTSSLIENSLVSNSTHISMENSLVLGNIEVSSSGHDDRPLGRQDKDSGSCHRLHVSREAREKQLEKDVQEAKRILAMR